MRPHQGSVPKAGYQSRLPKEFSAVTKSSQQENFKSSQQLPKPVLSREQTPARTDQLLTIIFSPKTRIAISPPRFLVEQGRSTVTSRAATPTHLGPLEEQRRRPHRPRRGYGHRRPHLCPKRGKRLRNALLMSETLALPLITVPELQV